MNSRSVEQMFDVVLYSRCSRDESTDLFFVKERTDVENEKTASEISGRI